MNATLNSHLSSAIVADRHSRAAHRRMVRLAESAARPATTTDPTPAQRRLRLRRATA
jgi:hypothetical protein